MKKCLSWLLLLTMLFTCLSVPAALADDEEGSGGVDIVIVLDQSISNNDSDPKDYRFDAAQMLIAMSDMEHSRVAIVPFNRQVVKADTEFVSISTRNSREAKMDALNKLGNVSAGTDYGEALAVAYNLIMNRQNTDNTPVIILLTDGENNLDYDGAPYFNKEKYEWDNGSRRFVKSSQKYNLDGDDADALARQVVTRAADASIPIYTVALTTSTTGGESYLNTLSNFSNDTGAKYFTVNSSNANEMPSKFAEIFADLVGSSLQQELEPVLVDAANRLYEVEVPILNTSVMEANLFVSLDSVVANTIKLLDNHGNNAENASSVMKLESEHFRMFKIVEPEDSDVGAWKLQFQLKGNANLSDVSFNLLYNYDLTLSAKVGRNVNSMAREISSVGKTDLLHLEVEFLDDATGQPTTDANLYRVQHTGRSDQWKTIMVNWELLYSNGTAVYSTTTGRTLTNAVPAEEQSRRFYTTIDLGSLLQGANGVNAFRSGNYVLRITADGAGLMQTTTVDFSVVNQAPVGSSFYEVIKVADGGVEGSYEPKAWTFNFADMCSISDPDRDALSFAEIRVDNITLGGDNGAASDVRALLDWNQADFTDDGSVTFTTKKAADGSMLHGEMNMTLIVQDSEGAVTEIPATIRVDSTEYNASQGEFSIEPAQTADADKNTEIALTAKAIPSAEVTEDGQGVVEAKVESITGATAMDQATLDQINAAMTSDGESFTFSVPTGTRKTEWTVVVGFYYNGHRLLSQSATISVGNAAPVIDEDVLAKIPTDVKFGGSFLSFLEPDTTAEELTVACNELFTDTAFNENPEDLTYTVALIDGDGSEVASEDAPLTAELADGVITMTPVSMGSVTVRFTVTDVDGEETVAEVKISTANMTVKWSMLWAVALAALIVLILVLRAIYWIQLPRFPKGTQLLVTEGQSISPTAMCDVAPGKKPERVLNFVGELATLYHLDGIEQIYIKPLRGRRDGSIYVYMDKKAPAITATLESEELLPGKKNKLVWHVDQRLYVQPADGGEGINIQLRNIEDNVVMDMGGNGWDGGVTNDGLGFGASVEGTGFDNSFDTGFETGFGGSDNGGFAAPADNGAQGFDSGFGGSDNNDIGF